MQRNNESVDSIKLDFFSNDIANELKAYILQFVSMEDKLSLREACEKISLKIHSIVAYVNSF